MYWVHYSVSNRDITHEFREVTLTKGAAVKADSTTTILEGIVRVNRWLFIFLFASLMTLTACEQNNEDDGEEDPTPAPTEYDELEIDLIDPNYVFTNQNETVTITGSGFGTDASLITVQFGDETASISQIENEKIVCEAPSSNEVSTVDMVVKTKDGRSYKVRNGFTYIEEGSVYITGVEPDLGSTEGGTEIKIKGGNFENGMKVSFRYKSVSEKVDLEVTCDDPSSDGTQIECTTPAHSSEEFVDIVLNDTEWVREDGFGYYNPPAISSVEVVEEDESTGTYQITINGANFVAERTTGTMISLDSSVLGCAAVSDTKIECSGVSGEAGESFQITVDVDGVGDDTASFKFPDFDIIEPPVVYAPEVTSLSISEGSVSGDNITIYGDHLDDVKVYFDGTQADCSTIQETQVECITPAHAPAEVTVKVANDNGSDQSQKFTYKEPTISSFSPMTGPTAGGTELTIYGTFFGIDAEKITVYVGWSAATDVKINEDGSISCKTSSMDDSTDAYIEVYVLYGANLSESSSVKSTDAFYYDSTLVVPKVESLAPTEGAVSGAEVTLKGSGLDGTTVKFGDTEAECSGSDTELVCAAPDHAPEEVTVTVSNDSGSDTSQIFTYKSPEITSFSPTSGDIAGGETITIYGNHFGTDPDAIWVFIGSARVTDITVESDGSLTGKTGSREEAGSFFISMYIVYNDTQMEHASSSERYTYEDGSVVEPKSKYAPEITDLDPSSGVASGGRQFVIKGKNFKKKFKVTMDGKSITSKCKRNNSKKITCKTRRLSSYENGAVSVDVVVENVVKKTKYKSDVFSYVYNNTPELTSGRELTKQGKKSSIISIKSGSKIDIHGINFGRKSEIEVQFKKEGSSKAKKGSDCTVNSKGTKITCTVPSFSSKKDVEVQVSVHNKFKRSFEETSSEGVSLKIKH